MTPLWGFRWNRGDGGSSRGETEKGEGSSPSKLCNPECIIHHRWETSKEGFLDSFVVVKHQKELISKTWSN